MAAPSTGRGRLARGNGLACGLDRQYYLADVIASIVAGNPQSQPDDLVLWAHTATQLKAVA